MKAWLKSHRAIVVGAAVLVLAAVVALLLVPARPGPVPPVATPSSTAATTTTTTTAATTSSTTPAQPPTTTAPPALPFPESLRGQDISRLPTDRKVVALTFDAGANAAGLPSVLRTLADRRVRATFFLTGNFAQQDPGSVQAILGAGHRVGNHSMTHPHLPLLTNDEVAAELRRAEQVLLRAGADPRPLFRFPYGDRDQRTIAAVNAQGCAAVRWTVDTLGWQGTSGGGNTERVVERVVTALQPGEIVLMHVGSHPTDGSTVDADALPDVIAAVRARGYEFVTLDAALETGSPR